MAHRTRLKTNVHKALVDALSHGKEHEILALWRNHENDTVKWGAEAYLQVGLRFRARDPLLAYEVFCEGLETFPRDQRLRFHQALTLARLGSSDRAMEMAIKLRSERIADHDLATDVASFVARLEKDRGLNAVDASARRRHLGAAIAQYVQAYERAGTGYKSYPAINAATLLLISGKIEEGRRFAAEAKACAIAELASLGGDDYWRLATIGEAALALGQNSEARQFYRRAVRRAGRRYDDIGSMRRNARLLARHLNLDIPWLEASLRIPPVVVFTGHMVDVPDRSHPRFPPRIEREVGKAIEARLKEINPGFGFSGAACGSDILFLEAMRKFGETHIVLPFDKNEFRKTSVDVVPGRNWSDRFNTVLVDAADVFTASGAPSEWGGIVYEYSNLLLLGLAQLKSRALDTELIGLAVWDGQSAGDGSGGTAWTVATWKRRQIRLETIDASHLLAKHPR